MSIKTYLLYCQYCGYKKITDGSDVKLTEIKTSPTMVTIPTLDPLTHKTIDAKFKNQKKRFKCPGCGRVIFPKKLKDDTTTSNNIGYQTGDEGSKIS